jgi:hypothetical protein
MVRDHVPRNSDEMIREVGIFLTQCSTSAKTVHIKMENLPTEVLSEILTWVLLLTDFNSTNSRGKPLFASKLAQFSDLNLMRFTHILKTIRIDGFPIHLRLADLQKTRFIRLMQANIVIPCCSEFCSDLLRFWLV